MSEREVTLRDLELERTPEQLRQQRGRMCISDEMLVAAPMSTLALIFQRLVIVRCEHNWATKVFEYDAISLDFDFVPDGMVSPEYQIQCTRCDDGTEHVQFVRVTEDQPQQKMVVRLECPACRDMITVSSILTGSGLRYAVKCPSCRSDFLTSEE